MSLPVDLAVLIANKDQYDIPDYDLQETIYKNMYIGDKPVLGTVVHANDALIEYVVLKDWCHQFGERYETIIELLDSLMLRWTVHHHISGIDGTRPLYWNEDTIQVAEYNTPEHTGIDVMEYHDVVVVGKDTAFDLAIRLGHIAKIHNVM